MEEKNPEEKIAEVSMIFLPSLAFSKNLRDTKRSKFLFTTSKD